MESKFPHSIGTSAAEREKILISSVVEKAKRQQEKIVKDIGIDTSFNEKEMKEYVQEVEKEDEIKP